MLSNPTTPVIATLRYAFLGADSFRWRHLPLSAAARTLILLVGVVIFHRVEKTASDTL